MGKMDKAELLKLLKEHLYIDLDINFDQLQVKLSWFDHESHNGSIEICSYSIHLPKE